ncbi:MAG: S24 family peptidase [Acidobacteriota bacterium]|nr:S24 family peptidase [Acidobacteriota bacterium]
MTFRQHLLDLIDRCGVSDRHLSILATGSSDTVRNIRRGSSPRLDSLEAICRVLGLRLQTAPLDDPVELPDGAPAVEKRPDWARRLREDIRSDLSLLLGQAKEEEVPAGDHHVTIKQLAAAAGSKEESKESVAGYITFTRSWLDRHGLYPHQCTIVGVRGESMAPTLPDGSAILVDRNRAQLQEGRIFVLQTDDGMMVKRLDRDPGGSWRLISDNPDWAPIPWPVGAKVFGEVRWVGKQV